MDLEYLIKELEIELPAELKRECLRAFGSHPNEEQIISWLFKREVIRWKQEHQGDLKCPDSPTKRS